MDRHMVKIFKMKIFLILLFLPLSCFAAKIVFVLPDVDDPFWSVVLNGSMNAADDLKVDLEVIKYSPTNPGDELNAIDIALSKPSSATIIAPQYESNKISKVIKKMSDADHFIQIINTGEKLTVQPRRPYLKANYIGMNDYQGGLLLGKSLQKLNVKKILIISHMQANSDVFTARMKGIQASLPSSKIYTINATNQSSVNAQEIILKRLF